MAVKVYLERAAVEQSPDQRRRASSWNALALDALQACYWERACDGDIKAAEFVTKLISLRIGMLGLEEVAASSQAVPTLIIAGTEEEFVAQMQAFVARRETAKRLPPAAPDHGDVSLESLQDQLPADAQ